MAAKSYFRQLANLITVSDMYSPFIASFESSRSVADVNEEWSEICDERGLDPMDVLTLTTRNSKVVGYLGFECLLSGKIIHECMYPIPPESIISSDTSLIDAIEAFSTTSEFLLMVLHGNKFVGSLSFQEIYKVPLRICLFAMLINVERLLLEVALLQPSESIQYLSEGRKEKAKAIYSMRKYKLTKDGDTYDSKLLECTTIIDKFTITRHTASVMQKVTALENVHLSRKAEILRNEIAHPGMEEQNSNLPNRESLWPFIKWAEKLEEQLQNYLESTRGY